jgi:hypothetical protein
MTTQQCQIGDWQFQDSEVVRGLMLRRATPDVADAEF